MGGLKLDCKPSCLAFVYSIMFPKQNANFVHWIWSQQLPSIGWQLWCYCFRVQIGDRFQVQEQSVSTKQCQVWWLWSLWRRKWWGWNLWCVS